MQDRLEALEAVLCDPSGNMFWNSLSISLYNSELSPFIRRWPSHSITWNIVVSLDVPLLSRLLLPPSIPSLMRRGGR